MGCKQSKSAVREPRGLTEQGIGKIAGGHSSLAPSVAASSPPPKPCGRTRMELDGLMEKVDQNLVRYERYFFKNAEAEANEYTIRSDLKKAVDRCKRVRLHHSRAPPGGERWRHDHGESYCRKQLTSYR